MTADQRDRIRAQVVASRRAQGLQATVPESRFLAELSAAILDQDPDLAPRARTGPGRARPDEGRRGLTQHHNLTATRRRRRS